MLGITMTNDGNIVDLGKAIEGAVAKLQTELPYGVELERVADQPTVVSESIWEFERSLLEALAIVLAVCLISLGWRTGIVVGLSVPIVLGVVALVMLATGWNLERVSLGSLIIALGLLVDDGIIAVEMMVVKMEEGWDRLKAAAFSYTATAMPRLTGALITVAAFMPIGFSQVDHGRVRGRHLLDRRHGSTLLVGRFRDYHALPCRQDAAQGLRQASRQRSVSTRRSTASCAAGSTLPSSGAGSSSARPSLPWSSRSSQADLCRSSFSPAARGRSWSSNCA